MAYVITYVICFARCIQVTLQITLLTVVETLLMLRVKTEEMSSSAQALVDFLIHTTE